MAAGSTALVPLPLAWMLSGGEWLIVCIFALILFGKRLPEIGRTLGKGIADFKNGLKDVEEELGCDPAEREHQDLDPLPLPMVVMGLLAWVCIVAGLEEASRTGRTYQATVLLAGGLVAGVLALLIHRKR